MCYFGRGTGFFEPKFYIQDFKINLENLNGIEKLTFCEPGIGITVVWLSLSSELVLLSSKNLINDRNCF